MARGNRITGIRRIVLALVGPRKILEDGRSRFEVVRVYPPQLSQNVSTGRLCICFGMFNYGGEVWGADCRKVAISR